MATDAMVTPTAVTPGFVAYESGGGYGKNYGGPIWSSAAPADVAIASSASVSNNTYSHFIRDSVERRADAAELRAEIKSLNARFESVCKDLSDVKASFAAAEAARLRSELDSVKLELLISKMSKKTTPPVES